MVQHDQLVGLDGVAVAFDDERAVADAGIVLCATLAQRLGIEALVDHTVDLGERPGGANAGAKVMTLISAMALGADCIDDCDLLRAGRTGQVLGHQVAAPSTLGTFLRSFTFGHVRQLDRVLADTLTRAWTAGAGPGNERLVVDVDSFVGEVFGHGKQGAGFGYTRVRGYHPLIATRADTGEVVHVRLRKGSANTSRGMLRFCDELIARIERAGATGSKLLRADSGFWSHKTFERLDRAGWQFSIGVRLQPAGRAAIEGIDESAWTTLEDYPPTSIAQIAETELGGRRLVVRRVRTLNAKASSCRPGSCFPLPPTAPTTSPSSKPSTASTPSSSWRSATSKTRPSPTFRPASSSRTLPGRSSRAWPTTCCAGPGARPAATDRPRRPHTAPAAARAAGTVDAHRQALDAAPTRPLALAAHLRRGARAHPSTRTRRLTRPQPLNDDRQVTAALRRSPLRRRRDTSPRRTPSTTADPHAALDRRTNPWSPPAQAVRAPYAPHRWIEAKRRGSVTAPRCVADPGARLTSKRIAYQR